MKNSAFKRMTKRTEFYIFIVLIILCIGIHIASGYQLLMPNSLFTILRSMVVDGILALCCLVVMISGGFDLSLPGSCSFGLFTGYYNLP